MTLNNLPDDLLILENVTVNYGVKIGLDSVNLNIKKGEIHAVVGSHGSGKSSLVDVISGNIPKTKGRIIFDNDIIEKHSSQKANKLGIITIYQNIRLVREMKVYENIFLNRTLTKYLVFLDRKKMRERAMEACKAISLKIDPDIPVSNYGTAEQYFIEISKLFCFPAKLVIIDEISNLLPPKDREKLHYLLSLLQNEGVTILYLTNDMDDISNFASRVSVLNNGKIVETIALSSADKFKLVQLTYSSLSSRQQLENNNLELYYLNNVNKNIISSLPFPILVSDSKNQIILMNKLFENVSGLKQNSCLKKNVNEILKVSESDQGDFLLSQSDYNIHDMNHIVIVCESKTLEADCKVFSFFDEDNSFIGRIYLISRIGNDFLFDRKLDYINNAVSHQKNLFGIFHELNNPLGIVLNYLKLIKQSKSLKDIQSNTDIMEKEIKRIKRFIRNSITTKENIKEAGNQVYFSDLIKEIGQFVKPEIDKKKITYHFMMKDDSLIESDADPIKQVILNIILNGLEALEINGELIINLYSKKYDNNDFSVIEIEDKGKGMPENIKKRIFQPFFTTKAGDGTRGLGLSLSQDIVKSLGGFIEVDSMIGRGTVFKVYFPRSK